MIATNNTQAQANAQYFDSVLYARAFINEIKIITPPKKGDKYCAINASIIDTFVDENGESKKSYKTIDLIVKGKPAKSLLWALRNRWPADRLKREDPRWIADINVGSIGSDAFRKKNGSIGAVLKGRLLNIRALRIGNEDVIGKITDDVPKPVLVAPCYVNLVDVAKGKAKVAILDGKIGEHSSQNVNLEFCDIPAFAELAQKGLCPQGYAHRDTNPCIFAIVEVEDFRTEGFKTDDGEIKSCLRGTLTKIRYLKANDKLIVTGKKVA